jgi:hypothetical protein
VVVECLLYPTMSYLAGQKDGECTDRGQKLREVAMNAQSPQGEENELVLVGICRPVS